MAEQAQSTPLHRKAPARRVFLDVGAHRGETLRAVKDPKYGFDRIVGFEPVKSCAQDLQDGSDARVEICAFGLSSETGSRTLFSPGSLAASIFADMSELPDGNKESCDFVRASDWFRANLSSDDVVFMKLNCEGSECDILNDLLDSGEFAKVSRVMIDFDVRKIPSQREREQQLRDRLARSGARNYDLCEEVMLGRTHLHRIQHWLWKAGAEGRGLAPMLRQARYIASSPPELRNELLGSAMNKRLRWLAPAARMLRRYFAGVK